MKNIFCVLCASILIFSCNKEEDLTNDQKLATLEGKKWVISEVIVDTANITASIAPCVLDNECIFYSDNTYELTEGDTTCVGQDDVTANGTWTFNEVNTTLKIEVNSDTTEYIIRELYKNQMRLYFIDQLTGKNIYWKLVAK